MTRKEFIEKNLRPKERKRFYKGLEKHVEQAWSIPQRGQAWLDNYLSSEVIPNFANDVRVIYGNRDTDTNLKSILGTEYYSRLHNALEEKLQSLST